MDWESLGIILGVLFGGGGLVSGYISLKEVRSKVRINEGEAAGKVSKAAGDAVQALMGPLSARLECVEAELTIKEKK